MFLGFRIPLARRGQLFQVEYGVDCFELETMKVVVEDQLLVDWNTQGFEVLYDLGNRSFPDFLVCSRRMMMIQLVV